MHTPTKVSYLQSSQAVEKVLWLDVTMDDVLRVHIQQGLAELVDVVSCLGLVKSVVRLSVKHYKQLSSWSVLQNQVDFIRIREKA